MDILTSLGLGFSVALSPVNLVYVTLGVIAGTLIGAMPGIGPVSGIAMLIPLCFGMNPTTAMILMAGVYYGGMYGGTITSVLMNVPGESSTIMTCLDGYAMALKGRAGPALTIAAIGSFVAGTFSVVMLMLLAPPLADAALNFGPAEYFALMVMGLTAISGLTGRSKLKGYSMALVGLALSVSGSDVMTGVPRFNFGSVDLLDGIDFLPIAVGIFGISEILITVERILSFKLINTSLREMIVKAQDLKTSALPIIRGTILGFVVGVLPGAGATIASFFAYATEKKLSKHPEQFGTGIIEGVAAPESANNAATGGAMVPLLTLGIPGSGSTAVMLGALTLFNVQPGPLLFTKNPEFVWGLIASMYIGNAMLLVLNSLFVPVFVSILKIPYRILAPLIVVFCLVGVYSFDFNTVQLWLMLAAAVVGYFMKKMDYPAAPLVLSIVLGGQMETHFRRALKISQGDLTTFFTRPISAFLMAVVFAILVWPLFQRYVIQPRRQGGEGVGQEIG